MAAPLTDGDKFLLLGAVGEPATRDRIAALLDLAGSGDVSGPGSSTDNALARFDGTTGDIVKNSGIVVSDSNAVTGIASLNGVTSAEIGYLSGVTSAIQTQLNAKINDAGDTLTGALLFPNGTAASPSISFSSFPNTGIYKSGAGAEWSVSVAGGQKLLIDSGSLYTVGSTNFEMLGSGVIRNSFGSAGVPSYSFSGDTGLGAYRSGSNEYSISTSGSQRLKIESGGRITIGTGVVPGAASAVLILDGPTTGSSTPRDNARLEMAPFAIRRSGHTGFERLNIDATFGVARELMDIQADGLFTIGYSGYSGIHNINGGLHITNLTASRAIQTDASQNLQASAVTTTELGFVSGVTSAIQTQLNGKQATGNYITDLTGEILATGPGSVAATVALATARASTGNATAITGADTTIIYEIEEYDASGSYNPVSGEFTAPSAGKYRVTASIDASSAAFNANDRIILKVFRNGSVHSWMAFETIAAADTLNMGTNGSVTLPCAASDVLKIVATSTTSISLNGETNRNYVCFEKVSN